MKRALLLGAALLLPLFWIVPGKAADSPPDDATEEEQPDVIPYKRDSVGGHFQLGARGSFAVPFGHVAEEVSQRQRAGDGWGALLDIGFGVNRNIMVGAYGEALWLSDSGDCKTCSATSYAAGAFVRYHLIQGLRFDPWVSYGLGYRQLNSDSLLGDRNYAGLEFLRLQLGATWSALPQLGLGPVMEFTGASMLSTPDGESIGGSSWTFQLGIRMSLDLPGR